MANTYMEPLVIPNGEGWAYSAPVGSPHYEAGTRAILAMFAAIPSA